MHSEITNFKYVISDHLGTAKMLIDEEGNVIWLIIGTVESNELLPFGGELDVFQSEGRYNLNFTNKELDRVLDLHYFGARYYQSGIGRFLSPDPIGGNPADPLSWNKYLYCRNNPIMFIDPTGMAMTAPKPDDLNGFEFVGPPEPPLSEQIDFKRADALQAGVSNDQLKPMSMVLKILSLFSGGPSVNSQKLVVKPTEALTENAGPTANISASEVVGKTPQEIDSRARELGLQPQGPNPAMGQGSCTDPQTGIQRILSHPNSTSPHAHINTTSGSRIDVTGRIVDLNSPAAHLPIKYP